MFPRDIIVVDEEFWGLIFCFQVWFLCNDISNKQAKFAIEIDKMMILVAKS